jgi:hypothetical protein
MDRLARCPECGGVTHPLAEHLVEKGKTPETQSAAARVQAASAKGKAIAASISDAPETIGCANCGELIGKLQKPLEWDGHAVCGPCYRELSLQKAGSPVQTTTTAIAVRQSDIPVPTAQGPTAPAGVIDPAARSASSRAGDFAIAMRGAVLGLCLTAIALYAIVTILKSLSELIVWGASIVAVLAAIYWIRRGIMAFRRRIGFPTESSGTRRVRSIVRD